VDARYQAPARARGMVPEWRRLPMH
jgi:hypothetical protein